MKSEISPTEKFNENTKDIDVKSTIDILKAINDEDKKVAFAVEKALPNIEKAVDIIVENFKKGGRLFYFGAGTSGRLGVLDASECPPTFSANKEMVQGYIAGGDSALRTAVEGAEDSIELAQKDFTRLNITKNDTVVSISASGNARYVVEILKLAKERGTKAIGISNNPNAELKNFSDVFIFLDTGAEVISGSTRMKAGTSQKMVLNMLTTASMIKLGKVYNNLMIDVMPTNEKLKERAKRIVKEITGADEETVLQALQNTNYKVKEAVILIRYSVSTERAEEMLRNSDGILKKVFLNYPII
ncbi:N-acetylmuramic acid 6-phosphate etherase [bacterium]|nr:N-acetylmuramic acid 6-phosphate etherase [bacterium]